MQSLLSFFGLSPVSQLVNYLLERLLGSYFIQPEKTSCSFKNPIFFNHLAINPKKINSTLLKDQPFSLKAGHISNVRLKVPWSDLLTQSIEASIEELEIHIVKTNDYQNEKSKFIEETDDKPIDFSKNSSVFRRIVEKIIKNLKVELKHCRLFIEVEPGFTVLFEANSFFFNFMPNLDYSLKLANIQIKTSKPVKETQKIFNLEGITVIIDKEAQKFRFCFKTLNINTDLDLINDLQRLNQKNYLGSSVKLLEKTEHFFRSQFSNGDSAHEETPLIFREELANYAEDEDLKSIISEIYVSFPDLRDPTPVVSIGNVEKALVFEIEGQRITINLMEELVKDDHERFLIEINGIMIEVSEMMIKVRIKEIEGFQENGRCGKIENIENSEHKCRESILKIRENALNVEKVRNNMKEKTKITMNQVNFSLSENTITKLKEYGDRITCLEEGKDEKPSKFEDFIVEIPKIDVLFKIYNKKTQSICEFCDIRPSNYTFQMSTDGLQFVSSQKTASMSLKLPKLLFSMQTPFKVKHEICYVFGFSFDIVGQVKRNPLLVPKIPKLRTICKVSEVKIMLDLCILYDFLVFIKKTSANFSQDEIFSELNASAREDHEYAKFQKTEKPFHLEAQIETLEVQTFGSENKIKYDPLVNRLSQLKLIFSNGDKENTYNLSFSLNNCKLFAYFPQISLDFIEVIDHPKDSPIINEMALIEALPDINFHLDIEIQSQDALRKPVMTDKKENEEPVSAELASVKNNSIVSEIFDEEQHSEFKVKSLNLELEGLEIRLGMLCLPVFQFFFQKIKEIFEIFHEESLAQSEKNTEIEWKILIKRVNFDIFQMVQEKTVRFLSARSLLIFRNIEFSEKIGNFYAEIQEVKAFFAYFTNKVQLSKIQTIDFIKLTNCDKISNVFKPIFEIHSFSKAPKKLEVKDIFVGFCKDSPVFLKKHLDFIIGELFEKISQIFQNNKETSDFCEENKNEASNFETFGKSIENSDNNSDSFEKCEKIEENHEKLTEFQIFLDSFIFYLYEGIDFPLISTNDFENFTISPPRQPKIEIKDGHFSFEKDSKEDKNNLTGQTTNSRIWSKYLQGNLKNLEISFLPSKTNIKLKDFKIFDRLDLKRPRRKAMGRLCKEYSICEFSILKEEGQSESLSIKLNPISLTLNTNILDFLLKVFYANADLLQDEKKPNFSEQIMKSNIYSINNEQENISETTFKGENNNFIDTGENFLREKESNSFSSGGKKYETGEYSEGMTKVSDSVNENKFVEFSQPITNKPGENRKNLKRMKKFSVEGFKLVINFEPYYQNLAYVFQDPIQLMNIGAINGLELWFKNIVLDDWEIENIAKFCFEVWTYDIKNNQKLEILKKMPYIDNFASLFSQMSRKIGFLFCKTN